MKTTGRTREVTAATQISRRIADLADWRGATLARVRELIHSADPAVVEEWKWMGTRGASIRDPQQLFNASLEGSTRRAIDLREGETLNAGAFKRLVRAASAANVSARAQRPAGKNSVRC